MDAFGTTPIGGCTMAEYLDQSAFDEKFEIEIASDSIRNIYHVENKYYVPVMTGSYREMYLYAIQYMTDPDDLFYHELMNPDNIMKYLENSETPGMVKAEFRQKLIDGTYRWVQYFGLTGTYNGVPEGKIYFYVFDIQNQKDRLNGKSISSMYARDSRDPKTGLLMQEVFVTSAAELMKKYQKSWCCLAIDIQNYKIFNAWFGKEKGDYLLAKIGSVLRTLEQEETAVAAYFYRDNFGVLLPYDMTMIERLYQNIKEVIGYYCNVVGFLPAFGVYVLEGEQQIGLDAYDRARMAVQDAKRSYLDRIKVFDSQKYAKRQKEFHLISDFQNALEQKEISFYIQPQCRITTGKIVGGEALARWVKKDGTVIPPGDFIPFLESSGFITELDKYIWDAVCSWIRSMFNKNVTLPPISINVSQLDLLSMDVAAYLYGLTERYNIPAKQIKVEITESAYAANYDVITKTIGDLKAKGFLVFLDDFGSGYSSLNMLDKVNVDVLKLDMAFMKHESRLSKKGISIVESIISMSKALGIPVVVEGVETEEQITFLSTLGCRYAQGYYFYRPMSKEAYEELLAKPGIVDQEGYKHRVTELLHAKEFLNETLFTGSMLNHILGAVAYYTLEGQDLTITRFNEMFYREIGDGKMDSRRAAIQNYVVKEDWPMLYQALENAENNVADGGSCEVRFYKSDSSVFWFHMKFFYLKKEDGKKLFYGKVEDITEFREQSIRFLEVLRKQSEVTMRMDLDRNIIQYVTGENTLYKTDLPYIDLDMSIQKTAENRIEKEADKQAFITFFDSERLIAAYHKAIYHEVLNIDFKLTTESEPVEFSTYYIRHSKDQSLTVYAFTKRKVNISQ